MEVPNMVDLSLDSNWSVSTVVLIKDQSCIPEWMMGNCGLFFLLSFSHPPLLHDTRERKEEMYILCIFSGLRDKYVNISAAVSQPPQLWVRLYPPVAGVFYSFIDPAGSSWPRQRSREPRHH